MKAKQTPLDKAIEQTKLATLSRELGVTYQAINKWRDAGQLPLTELSGKTRYAALIEAATGGAVTQQELIDWSFPLRLREACPRCFFDPTQKIEVKPCPARAKIEKNCTQSA